MEHGLPNPLSTCYINSFLQCMMATKAFADACESAGDPLGFMKLRDVNDKEELKKNYREMIQKLRKHIPSIKVFEFNDVHEFMMLCMDFMHEKSRGPLVLLEMRRCSKNPYARLKKMCDEALAEQNSCFSHKFYSTMVLQTDCGYCQSVNLNVELVLSIDISNGLERSHGDFDYLLKKHFRSMKVPDWKCDNCDKCHAESVRYMYIWRPADVMIVLIKRTRYVKGRAYKLTQLIEPPPSLDIEKYILCREESSKFTMRSLCTHHGDVQYGHYTASICQGESFKVYDDMIISRANSFDKENVYMILYEKIVDV